MKKWLDSLILAWAEWTLARGELRLADYRHHLDKWGFANTPSEDARARRRIEKLEVKLDRLRSTLERVNKRSAS